MTDMERGVRRYLDFVMTDQGLSATALAKKAGVATSTLTRFLNDSTYTFKLSSTTIEKIAKATEVSPAPFFEGFDAVKLNQHVQGKLRGQKNEGSAFPVRVPDTEVGVWRENVPVFWDDEFHQIEVHKFYTHETFVSKFRGRTVKGVASDGDYLFCVRTDVYLEQNRVIGERAVIIQSMRDNHLIELTVGSAYRADDAIWLRALQKPDYVEPISITGTESDHPIKIVGFVLFSFRYPEVPPIEATRSP